MSRVDNPHAPTLFTLGALVLATLACAGIAGESPEQTVESFLRAGSADDLEAVRERVDPKCHDKPVGRAAAVKMMGAPVTLDEVHVAETSNDGTTATVSWSYQGHVEKGAAKAKVLGVSIEVENLEIGDLSQSGEYTLKKLGGRWRISC